MKVYIVSYPCCEDYIRDKVFLDEKMARIYTENKTNWLVEEVEVSE
jgi:hypothetical protein